MSCVAVCAPGRFVGRARWDALVAPTSPDSAAERQAGHSGGACGQAHALSHSLLLLFSRVRCVEAFAHVASAELMLQTSREITYIRQLSPISPGKRWRRLPNG